MVMKRWIKIVWDGRRKRSSMEEGEEPRVHLNVIDKTHKEI